MIIYSYTNESSTGNFNQLAANKLKNGIVHLAIDQFETCQQNGNHVTQQDVVRLWKALVDVACKPDCGCAQALRTHVSPPHACLGTES